MPVSDAALLRSLVQLVDGGIEPRQLEACSSSLSFRDFVSLHLTARPCHSALLPFASEAPCQQRL